MSTRINKKIIPLNGDNNRRCMCLVLLWGCNNNPTISGGGSVSKGGAPTQCFLLLFLLASIPHLFQVPTMLENVHTALSHLIFSKSLQSDGINSDFTDESRETHDGSMVPSIMCTISGRSGRGTVLLDFQGVRSQLAPCGFLPLPEIIFVATHSVYIPYFHGSLFQSW